jgi:hypothetical protein
MRTIKRPRRYVARHWVAMGRPVFRFSEHRDAYVLRVVGRKWGPVLRIDRREEGRAFESAADRRGSRARVA